MKLEKLVFRILILIINNNNNLIEVYLIFLI
jgi:hypothetical protein